MALTMASDGLSVPAAFYALRLENSFCFLTTFNQLRLIPVPFDENTHPHAARQAQRTPVNSQYEESSVKSQESKLKTASTSLPLLRPGSPPIRILILKISDSCDVRLLYSDELQSSRKELCAISFSL